MNLIPAKEYLPISSAWLGNVTWLAVRSAELHGRLQLTEMALTSRDKRPESAYLKESITIIFLTKISITMCHAHDSS